MNSRLGKTVAISWPRALSSFMSENKNTYPACFGLLDSVFPAGTAGYRNTPEVCLACFHKTDCLKTALAGCGGLRVREELIDRAYASGMIGFLERWSKKKDLRRKIKDKFKRGH